MKGKMPGGGMPGGAGRGMPRGMPPKGMPPREMPPKNMPKGKHEMPGGMMMDDAEMREMYDRMMKSPNRGGRGKR